VREVLANASAVLENWLANFEYMRRTPSSRSTPTASATATAR
jgi:hypothetical protein